MVLTIWCNISFSQINIDTSLVASFDSVQYYYVFKPNNLSVNDLLNFHSSNFRLGNNSGLAKWNESTDISGKKVIRYLQTFNNVPVEDSRINLQLNLSLNPTTANGRVFNNINLNTSPSVAQNTAIQTAISYINATKYYWQDSILEAEIKIEKNDPTATYYPKPLLTILPIYNNNAIQSFMLCYKVQVSSFEPHNVVDIYIDANTGVFVSKRQISVTCANNHKNKNDANNNKPSNNRNNALAACSDAACQQGTAGLHAYGSQYIYTDRFTDFFCMWRTKDNCTDNGKFTSLYTRKYDYPGPQIADISHNSNLWGTLISEEQQDAVTAHFSLRRTHDYFKDRYGRHSWDGNYSQLSMYINWDNPDDPGTTNSAFTGNSILISKKFGYQHPLVFLDVIGHEFTHGITHTTAYLNYYGESGALNEGFSDIFGTMVEFYGVYGTGVTANYEMFELAKSPVTGGGTRNMANPKQFGQPDTYNGTNWASLTGNDYGGVHTNSGVLNYWFYLLAEGSNGSKVNDPPFNNTYCVNGIGQSKASDIAWKTLTTKLLSTSNYSNCRFLSIQAATELFGANSNEVAQTTAAWFAVGVGPNNNGTIDVKNHTAVGAENYNYNNRVEVQNFICNSGSNVNVTSNTEIAILPDFSAVSGSDFQAYIAPACAGGARMSNPNAGSPKNIGNSNLAEINSINKDAKQLNNSKRYEFSVMPNPNNGNFKLTLNDNEEFPNSISVEDLLGKTILSVNNITSYNFDLSLGNISNGMFIVKVNYPDRTLTKRIIKN